VQVRESQFGGEAESNHRGRRPQTGACDGQSGYAELKPDVVELE